MDCNGPRPYDWMKGYRDFRQQQYMNIGWRASPYPGKIGQGDYGPKKASGGCDGDGRDIKPYPLDFTTSRYVGVYAEDIPLRNRVWVTSPSAPKC